MLCEPRSKKEAAPQANYSAWSPVETLRDVARHGRLGQARPNIIPLCATVCQQVQQWMSAGDWEALAKDPSASLR